MWCDVICIILTSRVLQVVQALMDNRTSVAWNQSDPDHVVRFPLNGYIKMTSLQAIQRLLADGFQVRVSLCMLLTITVVLVLVSTFVLAQLGSETSGL